MPTKLQLCKQLHQELKIAGTLTTTIGQIGQLDRLCNAIIKADRFIQLLYTNWRFRWREWENTLVEGMGVYTGPDGLSSFDEVSFWVNAGTSEAYRLEYKDYKEWRDELRHNYTETGSPAYVVIKPNNSIVFVPTPNDEAAGDVVTADYWLTHVQLTDDKQVSIIPEDFHDAIVAMGKYFYGEYTQNAELQNSAMQQYTPVMKSLEAHSLPGKHDDNKSEASFEMISRVE